MKISKISFNYLAFLAVVMILFSCSYDKKNSSETTNIKIQNSSDLDSINYWNIKSLKLINIDFDSSGYYAEKALNLSVKINNDSTKCVAMVNFGFYYLQKKDSVKANELIHNAIITFRNTKNRQLEAPILKVIGRNYRKINDFKSALDYYTKALNIYTDLQDIKMIADLKSQKIAELYLDIGLYAKANEVLNQSLEISKAINYNRGISDACINISWNYIIPNDSIHYLEGKYFLQNTFRKYGPFSDTLQLAKLYWNLGLCYAGIKVYDSAIIYYSKSIDLYKKAGKGIDTRLIDNIANSYDDSKQADSSRKYFLMAYDSSMNLKNENRIVALFYLGSYYKEKKEYKKAISYLLDCINLGKEIYHDLENKDNFLWAYKSLVKTYDSLHDYKSAYKYYMEYSKLNDINLNQGNSREILKINLQNELNQQLKEQEKQQEKLRSALIYLTIGFSLLLILAFFIYRSYIIKKRANKDLSEMNKIISDTNTRLTELNDQVSDQVFELEALNDDLRIKNEEIEKTYNIIESDIQKAAKYVYTLMPQWIDTDKIKTDWYFKPCSRLGGDAFGFHWIDKENFAIYLLDVCGHGVGAALHSVSVLNMIKSKTLNIDLRKPEVVVNTLNNTYQMLDHNDLYFTLWYGVYNITRNELEYISAGHPAPILIDTTQQVTYLDTNNLAVGIVPRWDFKSDILKLKRKSKIHIFSDGVYEIKKPDGKMMYIEEFYDILRKINSTEELETNDDWATLVYKTMLELNNQSELDDDFSLLRIEIK